MGNTGSTQDQNMGICTGWELTRYMRILYYKQKTGSGLVHILSGFAPRKVISSEPKSNLPSRTYVIRPIPRFDPHAHTILVARGCSSEKLYSSSDAVGAPQLDL